MNTYLEQIIHNVEMRTDFHIIIKINGNCCELWLPMCLKGLILYGSLWKIEGMTIRALGLPVYKMWTFNLSSSCLHQLLPWVYRQGSSVCVFGVITESKYTYCSVPLAHESVLSRPPRSGLWQTLPSQTVCNEDILKESISEIVLVTRIR